MWAGAMDVPDNIANFAYLLSCVAPVKQADGEKAAIMSTPGALMSGCNRSYYKVFRSYMLRHCSLIHQYEIPTLRMLDETGFGPLEEKETTTGAFKSKDPDLSIYGSGFLLNEKLHQTH